jgi:hypothetical protein
MTSLFALTMDLPQFLPVLVGGSVFGMTASVGQLAVDAWARDPQELTLADERRTGCRPAVDRRQSLRRTSMPVRVEVVDRRYGWAERGWVVDRSTGGLGVELDVPARMGGVLDLRPLHTPGQQVWVLAVVRSCLDLADCWKVGCQFVQPQPSGVIRLFG